MSSLVSPAAVGSKVNQSPISADGRGTSSTISERCARYEYSRLCRRRERTTSVPGRAADAWRLPTRATLVPVQALNELYNVLVRKAGGRPRMLVDRRLVEPLALRSGSSKESEALCGGPPAVARLEMHAARGIPI
jgi:hypothetical protein